MQQARLRPLSSHPKPEAHSVQGETANQSLTVKMDEPDRAKFDVAKKLGNRIGDICQQYRAYWTSTDPTEQQIGLAVYFIDTFLFRVGNERNDSPDTVGCCSLRFEHFDLKKNVIKFDFRSKGNQPYRNEKEIDPGAFEVLEKLNKNNSDPSAKLFDLINPKKINEWLKQFDKDFTTKVFRTFRATHLMEEMLKQNSEEISNTKGEFAKNDIRDMFEESCLEVAKLCNHLKKDKKIERKILKSEELIKSPATNSFFEKFIERDNKNEEAKLQVLKAVAERKETSTNNTLEFYIDPRIVVAWCKKHGIELNRIYSPSLLEKIKWAIEDIDSSSQPGSSSGQTSQNSGTTATGTESTSETMEGIN
nr:DNA topoisomerase 1-like [Aedes albopictus]XP_029724993.1 DNA topoisomerase 1-like [Aedes albopictus]XP_029724999.1 DNA topoisomerase 1-like [Aedes albopictus]